MKHQWLAYVIVAFLSIGAGVAIAGMPNNVPVDATIIPPTTTEAPTPTAPEITVATTDPPETTEPDTTEPDTTDPDTTDPADVPDRSEITVGAANGAGIAGTAARTVARLVDLGYVDITPLDGTEVVDLTTIYYADGFEAAAARMADDFDIAPELIAPLVDAPDVPDLQADTQIFVYVGIDRAN